MFIVQLYNDYETVCVGHMLEALCPLCPFENLLLLPPPKKEVMFLVRSVCLSVRRITRKLVNGF